MDIIKVISLIADLITILLFLIPVLKFIYVHIISVSFNNFIPRIIKLLRKFNGQTKRK